MHKGYGYLIGLFSALLSLVLLIGLYKAKSKSLVVVKNHLDEPVTFRLFTETWAVDYTLMPEASYFYKLRDKNKTLKIIVPRLGNKPSHVRVLKEKKEAYQHIYASFVFYDALHKDLRIRREV